MTTWTYFSETRDSLYGKPYQSIWMETKTDLGMTISVYFENDKPDYVTMDADNHEFDLSDNIAKEIFIRFDKNLISLETLAKYALDKFYPVQEEQEQEEKEYADHVAEMSCPHATNRI